MQMSISGGLGKQTNPAAKTASALHLIFYIVLPRDITAGHGM